MTLLKEKIFDIAISENMEEVVKSALKEIEQRSFPERKTEDWRYAKLGKILSKNYESDATDVNQVSEFLMEGLDANVVVLINGKFSNEFTKIEKQTGVTISSINEAVSNVEFKNHFNKLAERSQEIFTSINTAYNQGGVFIHVEKNVIVEKPIYMINVTSGNGMICNTRNLIVLEKFAEAKVIQGFYSTEGKENLNNSLTESFVKQNAKLNIEKIQNFSMSDRHICTEEIHQEKDSTATINTFMLSGGFIRNGLNIQVDGTNCYSEMNGLFLGTEEQYIDNHTKIEHIKSNCTSSELYKGILKDKSVGVFNGKVIVHKDAQVIEAYQQNNNVILSDEARMNTKPELEIFADDVKCSHGATTGQFDEEAVFYLQARGVSKTAAKEMLIGAFATEVLDKISIPEVRTYIEKSI